MDRFLNARFRLTLADADAGGGSGGGGGATPPADYQPTTGAGPLPGQRARADLYDRLSPDSAPPDESGETKDQTPPKDTKEGGTDSPPVEKPDSAPAPSGEEGEGTDSEGKQSKRDARVSEAQRKFHEKSEEAKREKERADKLQADLELVNRYVDMDKLRGYHKEQSAKDLDKPLTRRDLEELKKPSPEPPADPTKLSPEEEAQRKEYLDGYTKKHPHMKDYLDTKEAYGVFLKTAEELGPEASLDEIGDAVADHFKKLDADRERKITERLTKSRKNLSAADTPRSTGTPRTGEEDQTVTDSPEDYVQERRARQNRAMRPQT